MSLHQWPIPTWFQATHWLNLSEDEQNTIHCLIDGLNRRMIWMERCQDAERDLAEARQTIEDIAIGVQMECATCGKYHPCGCDKI